MRAVGTALASAARLQASRSLFRKAASPIGRRTGLQNTRKTFQVAPSPASFGMVQRARREISVSSSSRAGSAAADGDDDAPPVPDTQHPTLMWINEFTKFGVSAAAFATLLFYHNAAASYALSGSIANSIAGKVLKRILNVPRPGTAPKADPGMPSSHALSLAYLSTYACAAVLSAHPPGTPGYSLAGAIPCCGACLSSLCNGLPLASAASLQGLGLFLTWLRVHLGYHTVDQVAVGYALGVFDALFLFQLGQTTVLPALKERPELESALYGVTTLAIGLFAFTASKWVREAAGRLGLRIAGKEGSKQK